MIKIKMKIGVKILISKNRRKMRGARVGILDEKVGRRRVKEKKKCRV